MGGIYEYALEVGSGAILYLPSFLKMGSSVQKLIRGYAETWIAQRPHKHTLGK
jgi:hypothetical protein